MSSQRFSPEFMDEAVKTIQSGVQARSLEADLQNYVSMSNRASAPTSQADAQTNELDQIKVTSSIVP